MTFFRVNPHIESTKDEDDVRVLLSLAKAPGSLSVAALDSVLEIGLTRVEGSVVRLHELGLLLASPGLAPAPDTYILTATGRTYAAQNGWDRDT